MTHDNARDALEYAALLLEQQDAGGTLPGILRQIADSYDNLLATCEAIVKCVGSWADWEDDARGHVCPVCSDYSFASASDIVHRDDCEYRQAIVAIAAARGNR